MKKENLYLGAYFAVMGIGLAIANYGFGASYGVPKFYIAAILIVACLLLFTLPFYFYNQTDFKVEWKSEIKPKYGYALFAIVPTAIVCVASFIVGFTPKVTYFIPLIAAILVGIAEEICFRGIHMGALLKQVTPGRAVLFSSISFSLIHAVNIFAGQGVGQVIVQLILTFLAGLFSGMIYIQTQKLSYVIVFHALWDYMAFNSVDSMKYYVLGYSLVMTAITAVIGVKYLRQIWNMQREDLMVTATVSAPETV